MAIFGYRTSIVLASILSATSVIAAPSQQTIDQAAQQAGQIQRDEQIRQQEQLKKDLSLKPSKPLMGEMPKAPDMPDGGVKRAIKEIVVSGNTLLSKSKIASITDKFENTELGAKEISSLMGELTLAYMKSGYSTARVYIPPQDLKKGTLTLNVVEGRVGSLVLDDGANGKSVNLKTAFPGMVGKALSIYDIEQGLDQINRLSSNSATMEIVPSSKDGESIIKVTNKPQSPYSFQLSMDNTGSKSSGRTQYGLNVSYDNLAGINDLLSVTARHSAPYYNNKMSSSRSMTYSVPYGYTTFSLSLNDSSFKSTMPAESGVINTDGYSKGTSLILDHVVSRGQTHKLSVSTSLNVKQNAFNILGEKVDVSSPDLTVVDADAKGFVNLGGVVINGSLGYSKGLKTLGSTKDEADIDIDHAHAQFSKIRYSLGASYTIPTTQPISLSSQLSGAHSFDALYGAEQFAVTGSSGVRGFYDTALSAARGWNVRNEIRTTMTLHHISVSPYIGYDFGRAFAFRGSANGQTGGGTIGVDLGVGGTKLSFEYSRHMWLPDYMTPEKSILTFRFSSSF